MILLLSTNSLQHSLILSRVLCQSPCDKACLPKIIHELYTLAMCPVLLRCGCIIFSIISCKLSTGTWGNAFRKHALHYKIYCKTKRICLHFTFFDLEFLQSEIRNLIMLRKSPSLKLYKIMFCLRSKVLKINLG